MNANDHYMCLTKKYHCIAESKRLMKSMREGCLAGSKGLKLSNNPALNMCPKEKKPRKETEVLGEPNSSH